MHTFKNTLPCVAGKSEYLSIFAVEMKTRDIIISIFFILLAFVLSRECNERNSDDIHEISGYELTSETYSFCIPDSELNLPRPTNFTNVPRCQTTAKRSSGGRIPSVHAFLKSGKFLTIQSRDLTRITSDLLPMGHRAGSDHLICLRQLLI